jgi:hypothetical protein
MWPPMSRCRTPGACVNWATRTLRKSHSAAPWSTVDGQLLDTARQALHNPKYRLIVTDAETIATRTDEWDPATETSSAQPMRMRWPPSSRRFETVSFWP